MEASIGTITTNMTDWRHDSESFGLPSKYLAQPDDTHGGIATCHAGKASSGVGTFGFRYTFRYTAAVIAKS